VISSVHFNGQWSDEIIGVGLVPTCLREILESNDIVKVGVGVLGKRLLLLYIITQRNHTDDADKLSVDWGIDVCNLVDLSSVARGLDPHWDEQDEIRAKEREVERLRKAQERAEAAAAKGEQSTTAAEVTNGEVKGTEFKKRRNGDEQDQQPKRPGLLALAKLTERYLSMQLLKPKKIRQGNWERRLTEEQVNCTY
jgi:hypothetical protein